jgi:hypothetical protein
VKTLSEAGNYPVALACDLLDLPRSSYYYQTHPRADATVVSALHELAGQFPT